MVDDGEVGGDEFAAVFFRGGKSEYVVILVDGSADRAQAVMTVGHGVTEREFLEPGRTRGLDDADVRDVVRGESVKGDVHSRSVLRAVVRTEDLIGHRVLARFVLGHGIGLAYLSVYKIYAFGLQFDGF